MFPSFLNVYGKDSIISWISATLSFSGEGGMENNMSKMAEIGVEFILLDVTEKKSNLDMADNL